MDIKEVQNLIKFVSKSEVSEVKLEMDKIKLTIKKNSENEQIVSSNLIAQPTLTAIDSVNAVVPASIPAETVTPTSEKQEESANYVTVKSPIIGTFYRKPSPDKANFVEVGQTVKEGDVLCVIEAMKLFNEIESEVSGKIVKILVDDSSPVEFDQPLFLVDPS